MNAEKLSIKTTKETLDRYTFNKDIETVYYFLVYDFESLIVSIGGFLGLFIGLSLYDVSANLIDLGDKLVKNVKKKI